MKRSASGSRSTTANSVEQYMAKVAEPARAALNRVRALIRAAAPEEATEGISYGLPMFKYKGVLLGVGAFRDHCSLFLGTSSLPPELREELKPYISSKGTIRFGTDKPLPAALVRKIVKARVAQNEQRSLEKLKKR